MKRISARFWLLVCLATAHPPAIQADAIVITQAMKASTIAEIFIEESVVRVEIEIGAADLPAFRNLMPDGLVERMGFPPEPLAERLPRFFRQDLVIRVDGGPPLRGRVSEIAPRQRVSRDEITGEALPVAEGAGETVVFAVLEYPFEGRPATMSFQPPLSQEGVARASIGMVVYHLGVASMDFRYFGTEEVLDLDWEDSFYSRFRNRNLRRQYDAPLHVFLYVEPYEVRVEIIARPKDLQQWVDLGLEGRSSIPVEDQAALKLKAGEFLARYSQVSIDGEPASGSLDRIHFLRRTLRNSTVIDPPEELDVLSATLGAIFVIPTVGLPQEAHLEWQLFGPKIDRVPAAATDEAGPLRFFLTPDDNVLWWKNFLKNPTLPTLVEIAPPPGWHLKALRWLGWVSSALFLVLAIRGLVSVIRGGGLPRGAVVVAAILLVVAAGSLVWARPLSTAEEGAEEIVAGLLHNIYRAFDFRDEETIYDLLDRSVDGDLLTETYLETRRGLELASQGGARAKVKEIEMLRVEADSLGAGRGFEAEVRWNVSGAVGHWGHIHQRTNQYAAELKVEPVAGVWKITEMELLEEERIR